MCEPQRTSWLMQSDGRYQSPSIEEIESTLKVKLVESHSTADTATRYTLFRTAKKMLQSTLEKRIVDMPQQHEGHIAYILNGFDQNRIVDQVGFKLIVQHMQEKNEMLSSWVSVNEKSGKQGATKSILSLINAEIHRQAPRMTKLEIKHAQHHGLEANTALKTENATLKHRLSEALAEAAKYKRESSAKDSRMYALQTVHNGDQAIIAELRAELEKVKLHNGILTRRSPHSTEVAAIDAMRFLENEATYLREQLFQNFNPRPHNASSADPHNGP